MADNERTVTTIEETDWGCAAVVIVLILCLTAYNLYELHLASKDNKAKIEMLQERIKAREAKE